LFGNLPVVKGNLSAVMMGIIVLSLMPIAIAWLKQRLSR
jgi:membrane-associated protein